mmetsp:Transcript_120465/g.239752  ORF Transcript_120465/g.239752 Transcript_120465/m.239752 type:complete len:295 (-) Transcript_120465:122-1006(-)
MFSKGLGAMLGHSSLEVSSLEVDLEAVKQRLTALETIFATHPPLCLEQRIKTLEVNTAEEIMQAQQLRRRVANLETVLMQDPLNVKVLEHRISNLETRSETMGSAIPKQQATKQEIAAVEDLKAQLLLSVEDLTCAEEITATLMASLEHVGKNKPKQSLAKPLLPVDFSWTSEPPMALELPWANKPPSPLSASTSMQSDRIMSDSCCSTPLSPSSSERSWGARHCSRPLETPETTAKQSLNAGLARRRQAAKFAKLALAHASELEAPVRSTPVAPKHNPLPGKSLFRGRIHFQI